MIVDAHVHLFPAGLARAIRAWFDQHAWQTQADLEGEQCVALLEKQGVDRCVALPYAHKPGMARALNEFTLELARRHPMVVPCCTVFPGEPDDEQILDEALALAHGVKIHCHVMRVAPDEPRMEFVWRASARHRKPVVVHCGREPASAGYGFDVREITGAARMRRVLDKHPEAVAVVPHLGIDEAPEFEALLDEHPQLYLDTAMAIAGYFPRGPDPEILRRRPDRILFGTDFPLLPYPWSRELEVVRGLKLPPRDEALILGGNAARLFQIQ